MLTANVSPFNRNAAPDPAATRMIPASAGPAMLATRRETELTALALVSRSAGTTAGSSAP